MRKLLFILPIILLVACEKQEETAKAQNMQPHVYLYYKNNSGQNLLSPTVPNALTASDIDVLDLSNQGHKIYFQNSKNANAILVLEHPAYGKVIKLPIQNGIKIGNKMTKFLQYSDYHEDKITIEESSHNGNIFINKIWLNDVLVATNNGSNQVEPIVILK